MEPAGKRQRRKPTTSHAEKAFAAIVAVSVISITAVLVTIFFVISSFYHDDTVESEIDKIISQTLDMIGDETK